MSFRSDSPRRLLEEAKDAVVARLPIDEVVMAVRRYVDARIANKSSTVHDDAGTPGSPTLLLVLREYSVDPNVAWLDRYFATGYLTCFARYQTDVLGFWSRKTYDEVTPDIMARIAQAMRDFDEIEDRIHQHYRHA